MESKNVEIRGKISVDTGESAKSINDLNKEIKDSRKAMNEAKIGSDEYKAAHNNLKNAQDELKASTGQTSTGFQNLKSKLSETSPAFKSATEGAGSFNGILNTLRANPIIFVITALVGLVVALFQPFKKMETVSDALNKSWGILSGTLNKFVNAILTPLIDGFVKLTELFNNSLIYVLDALGISSKETSERIGAITDALDDLEDAEKNSAIATAESNRKLQEAREIAGDANVPIKQRIAALKEAGKIEKEELDKVVQINQTKAKLTMEAIAIELGARSELIAKIQEGSLASLKAAREELMSMKNVDKEKLSSIDAMIIAAENAAAQSAKIGKKTQSAITSLEKEEQNKREQQEKEAEQKRQELRKKREDAEKKHQEELKKIAENGRKAIEEAEKALFGNDFNYKAEQLRKERDLRLEAARKANLDTKQIYQAFYKEMDDLYQQNLAAKEKADKDAAAKKDADMQAEDEKTQAHQLKVIGSLKNYLVDSINAEHEAKEAKKKIAEEHVELQRNQINEVGTLLGNASKIFGQQTAVGKGISIAQALINTYSGATDALRAKSTLPSPFDVVAKVVNVAAVLKTGFEAVKNITKVQVPGAGGGSGSVGSISTSIPAPIAPTQSSTALDANTIQAVGNAANSGTNRAFVLNTDISNNHEKNEWINRSARLD